MKTRQQESHSITVIGFRSWLAALALVLVTMQSAQAQTTFTRQNNATTLNLAGAWSAGGPPTGTDIAMWDATIPTSGGNPGTALGGNVTWGQIQITNPGQNITIANTASSTLTLNGVSGVGIDMSAANQNLTINNPITLGGAQTWNVGSGRTLTLSATYTLNNGGNLLTVDGAGTTVIVGPITGLGGVTMNGAGRLQFGTGTVPTHTYSGETILNGGVTMIAGNLSANSLLTMNGGVLEDYWQTAFTRALGTGAGQVRIIGGASGFGNNNGSNAVRINTNAAYEVVWGAANEAGNANATGFFNPSTFVLQTQYSQGANTLTFENKIDLNGTTRTIQANAGVAGTSMSTISGAIRTSSGTAGLTKTGAGILLLSNGANAWNGSTVISQGLLDLGTMTSANLGGGSGRNVTVAAGAAIRFNALSNAFLNRLVETNAEITVMTGATANNLDFSSSTGANLPQAFLGNWASNGAKMEYTGTLTPASDNYRLGGKYSNGLLGIVGANKLTGSQGLIVGGTGGSGIRVEIAAAQNFTGDTVVNTGARLSLGNNLALQNSVFDVGAAGGNFSLAAGTNGGRITGETASPSPTFGGLKGSRNLLSVFSATGGNNETLLAASTVIGFTLNPGTGVTCTYSGAIQNFTNGTTITKSGAGTQIFTGTNTYSGTTTISAGVLSLGHALALQNSPLNTTGSVTGDANNGLQTTVTTLTFGGLTGSKNLADLFTTTSGGYGSVTALTLNPGSGATNSYAGIIADGATGMSLTKSGAGIQILAGANAYTGNTTVNAGTLLVNSPGSLAAGSAVTVSSGAVLGGDGTINGTVSVLNGGTLGGTNTINGTVTASVGAILSPAGSGTIGTMTLANAGDALTLNGSVLNVDLPTSGTVCDLIAITGNLVVNGATTVNVSGPNGVAAGTYTLMTYGSTNGLGSIVFPNGSTTMGNLTLTAGPTNLTLTVGAGGYNATVWKGTVNGLWDTATANWARNGVAGQAYVDGDAVLIDDTATATTISNSVPVSPTSVTVNNSAKNFTVTATLGGTGTPLLKSGSGTLTLSGANAYSGGTLVTAGTLSISANNNLGANGSPLTFNGSGGLILTAAMTSDHPIALGTNVLMSLQNTTGSSTLSGAITGNGGIAWVAGGSGLTLSSTGNTFTGPIIAPNSPNNNDTLNFSSIGDAPGAGSISFSRTSYLTHIGYNGSANLTLNYRQIEIKGYNVDGMGAPVNQLKVNGAGSLTINTDLLPSGAAGVRLLGLSGTGTGYYNGRLVDGAGLAVSITKRDGGKWTFSGTNTYTGATKIEGGILNVQNASGLGTTAGGSSVSTGAALELQGGIAIDAEALALNGGGVSSGGALRNISGDNSYAGLITLGSAARINSDTNTLTLDVASGNAITGTQNLTFGGAGNIVVADPIATGTGTVTKDGNGTVMLSSTNTYSGLTTVSAGTLNVQNDSGLGTTAGGVSVTSGAALELQGGIAIGAEALTLNGTGIKNGGALRNISGDNSYAGLITLGSAARINSATNTLTLDVASGNAITGTQNLVFGGAGNIAVADPIATSTGTVTKDGFGTLTLSGSNTYSGVTMITNGILMGVTGGSCLGSSVTVTNTPGNISALAIRVTNTNLPWSCSSLAFKTNGLGSQLQFSFATEPSKTLAPLNITNTLTFAGAPVVVVNMANIPSGTYPLLVVGGATAPTTIPAVILVGSESEGSLAWAGTGNKTLFLTVISKGTFISLY